MRRKLLILITSLVCLSAKIHNCHAQKFYGEIQSSYGFSVASQNLTSKIDDGIAQTSNVLVRGSLGKGLLLGGYIGYKKMKVLEQNLESLI